MRLNIPPSIAALTLAALLATAGLAAAQTEAQEHVVAASGTWAEEPTELPGSYRAEVTVTVTLSGGACACQATTVEMAAQPPEGLSGVTFDPTSYEIDWLAESESQMSPAGEHTQTVNLTFELPESFYGQDEALLVVNATASDGSPLTTYNAQPAQLTINIPSPPPTDDGDGGASMEGPGDGGASSNGTGMANDTVPPPADTGGEDTDDAPGPAIGLVAAAVAAAAVAARRRS